METQPVFDISAEHGEGPIWDHRSQHLMWVDIVSSCFYEADLEEGQVYRHNVGSHLGALGLACDDQVVLAVRNGFASYTKTTRRLHAIEPYVVASDDIRFNDGAVSPDGRFFAGTMPYDCQRPVGQLFCLSNDPISSSGGQSWKLADRHAYTVCNGVDWSLDGQTMYFIDSPSHKMYAFDYDADGNLSNRRVHIDFGPTLIPDGMCMDSQDGFWIAFWGAGEVRHYSADRDLIQKINVPARHTTSCCFGGPDLDQLYITTSRMDLTEKQLALEPLAGRVFTCRVDAQGKEAFVFGG